MAITPERVLRLTSCCQMLFQLKRPEIPLNWEDIDPAEEGRTVNYKFPISFLQAKNIGTTFYFVDNKLVLHNKASYSYC
nr:hypothetical protein HK105_006408 [Polyrhizophydium stewartii]